MGYYTYVKTSNHAGSWTEQATQELLNEILEAQSEPAPEPKEDPATAEKRRYYNLCYCARERGWQTMLERRADGYLRVVFQKAGQSVGSLWYTDPRQAVINALEALAPLL